jgi:hypothetical protein
MFLKILGIPLDELTPEYEFKQFIRSMPDAGKKKAPTFNYSAMCEWYKEKIDSGAHVDAVEVGVELSLTSALWYCALESYDLRHTRTAIVNTSARLPMYCRWWQINTNITNRLLIFSLFSLP